MLAKTYSATHSGVDGTVVEIEGALQRALPTILITGLPGDVIRESRERVKSCLVAMGFDVPTSKLVIHLSPASARKQGSQLDLAIALAVLKTEGLLQNISLSRMAFLGELALDGRVHRVGGAVALLQALDRCAFVDTIVVSSENAWEASLVDSPKVRLVGTLVEAIEFVRGQVPLTPPPPLELSTKPLRSPSLDAVIGQGLAKRALQIALAGRHHLLLLGPPGVGKSLLAQCAPDLMPPLERQEWVEVVKAQGPHDLANPKDRNRPFRSPHHSISGAALLGGGSATVVPGEVSLAHHGVLFLDEFPEFRRDVIEGLREPLQNGVIHLHRIGHALSLPARFTLIAAMNPCPCGYSMGSMRRCLCSAEKLLSYRRRTSGPILDRIDLCVLLTTPRKMNRDFRGLSHNEVEESVERVWRLQKLRAAEASCRLQPAAGEWLERISESEELSFRSRHKMLKVARTIADIEGRDLISLDDLQEAWGLRCPEFYKAVYN